MKYIDFDNIEVNTDWAFDNVRSTEQWTHGYHRYPAKFLPNVVKKLIEKYATTDGVIADLFAGCGTTLVEAKVHGIHSTGTDVNPVATLITKSKITPIEPTLLSGECEKFINSFSSFEEKELVDIAKHERLDYWFLPSEKSKIAFLYKNILENITDKQIQVFLLVCLSHILKNCSRWLQSSTKPQVDPNKEISDPFLAFKLHCKQMQQKNELFYNELSLKGFMNVRCDIKEEDARNTSIESNSVDIVITSPPYVTSYEYADIHQLTGYWFDYFSDITKFRKLFIGTSYSDNKDTQIASSLGAKIVKELHDKDKRVACDVANYFNDMQKVANEMYRILKEDGYACIVIGNTTIKDVHIKSAEVFFDLLKMAGFRKKEIIKRNIPYKLMPTLRDKITGKFTTLDNSNCKQVYPNEYIVIVKKISMAIIKQNSMPFKPYARLMNIIGDQLITDKKVAVIEIIKNCYDADAESVKVRFGNMNNVGFHDLPLEEQAYIEIEDEGCGMSLEVIENVWLRPATPNKIEKKRNKITKTPKGRIIQGEKGIGRFAIHKLGEKIELYSKAQGQDEVKLEMNFSDFNPESQNLFNQSADYKLLEDVSNNLYVNSPPERVISQSGTIIRIYNLRESWNKRDFDELYKNIQRLIPPVDKNAESLGIDFVSDFSIDLYKDDKFYTCEEVMTFNDVIERAQYTMIGTISEDGILEFRYKSTTPLRSFESTINLLDNDELMANNYSLVGSKWFTENKRNPKCGSFSFTFYAFNLAKPDKTILNEDLKKFIKENFVFVLRDGVRVYPYGEKGIDWLNLDKLRSTYRAGQFISYNDLTGFIYISQEKNPELSDSSNRQGIVNNGGRYDDFTSLITAATEIFNTEIKIDKLKEEIQKKALQGKSKDILKESFEQLQSSLCKIDNTETLSIANKFIDVYQKHLDVIEGRMETVEDLAGLGMAVEKSSHDSLRLLSLMRHNIKDFKKKVEKENYEHNELISLLNELDENIEIVYDDMQMIQPLFKIQRKSITDVSVTESIQKVIKYFRSDIDNKITTNIENGLGDLSIKTNAGLILQVLINLVDNSVFWLKSSDNADKQIHFHLNPLEQTLIVADNGKGIRDDVAPLIFQEFFSMKSDGRGLGLYIVRELLLRIGAEIHVLTNPQDKILSGANFIIKFNTKES